MKFLVKVCSYAIVGYVAYNVGEFVGYCKGLKTMADVTESRIGVTINGDGVKVDMTPLKEAKDSVSYSTCAGGEDFLN